MQEKTLLENEHTALQEEHSYAEQEHILACNTINKQRSRMYNWSDGNGFALLKKNNDEALPYYVIRCNDKNISNRIKRLQKSGKYSNSTILFQTGCIPSGVNLYQKNKKTTWC